MAVLTHGSKERRSCLFSLWLSSKVDWMNGCSAPWYELNLSAPDSNVSACCYYGGQRDYWHDHGVDLDSYWNGPGIREIRRIQAGKVSASNGCSSCFYFQQTLSGKGWVGDNYYDFAKLPEKLSPAQEENWLLAKADFEAGVEIARCTPLKLYANFGYTCNISCRMCHQVPRRGELKRQILADTILSWHDALERCLEFYVIGGEPFAIPEAVKFIRKFAPDERYDAVRLVILNNGTVLHKHWDTLRQKRNLWIGVSLDSIGDGYNQIRLGGNWADVERNILTALEIKSKTHPDWTVSTNANIQKAGIPYLPDFARWHVKHGVHTFFFDFISAPGVEDTFHTDNVLQNPQLLDSIPRWKEYFEEAAAIFRSGGWNAQAALLEQYSARVVASAEEKSERIASMRRLRGRNDWSSITARDGSRNLVNEVTPASKDTSSEVPLVRVGSLTGFAKTRLGDSFRSDLIPLLVPQGGGKFRVRAHWPKGVAADGYTRLAHVVVQDNYGTELVDFREYFDFGFGTELTLVGDVPAGTKALRLILKPLGEEVTLLPDTLELDVDPDTVRGALEDEVITGARRVRKFALWARDGVRRLVRSG